MTIDLDERRELERQWLAGLEVGDEVVVNWSMSHGLGKVTHCTATQIHVGASKFRRKDGYGCGPHRGSISMPTQEIRDDIEKDKLVNRVARMEWSTVKKMSLEKLRRIAAILDDPDQPKPATD